VPHAKADRARFVHGRTAMTTSTWTAAGLWAAARDPFLADWRSIPAARRRSMLRVLGWGLAAALLFTAVLSLGARSWLGETPPAYDVRFVEAADGWSLPSFSKAIWLEEPGGAVTLTPLVLLVVWGAARSGRSRVAIAAAAAYLGARPIMILGRLLYERARPDLIAGGIAAPGTNSFPSGHTLQAVCVWGVLAWLWARKSGSVLERVIVALAWLGVVTIVAAARLRLGTHWPTDILFGAALGLVWAGVVIAAVRASESP
jgi:undecaprenyl-diphosphatase